MQVPRAFSLSGRGLAPPLQRRLRCGIRREEGLDGQLRSVTSTGVPKMVMG
jgi:hypothetical protein